MSLRRIAWCAVAVTVLLACSRRLSDPDLPWHLAVGRAAVSAHGALPADAFSYTQAGRPVPYEYASELALYGAQRLAGFWGLHALAASALALLAWLLVASAVAEAMPLALVFCALALAALAPFLILRPALLGLPCWAAVLLCLERHRKTGRPLWLWFLVPLQLLWANVHAFAPVGAAAVALYALCTFRRPALLAAAAAGAATTLSSFGPGIYLGPWRVAGHSAYLAEWASASFGLFWRYDPALGLLVLLTLAALCAERPPLFDGLLLAGTFLLTLLRFRLAPLFIVAASPWAARALWSPWRNWRGQAASLMAVSLLAPVAVALRTDVPWGLGFDESRLPVAATRFAAEQRLQGPVFNDIAFGGYLIWRLGPQGKVFIDGRTAYLYPPEFLAQAWRAQYRSQDFSELCGRYGFQWALVDAQPGSEAAQPLAASPDWAMVYLDDTAAVYVNIKGPNRRLMWSGYQGLRHLTPASLLLSQGLPPSVLEHDVALALRQAPDSRRARQWASALSLRRAQGR